MTLTGKAVLITGGARGIGAETGRRLAARGARVALLDLDGRAAAATARGIGPEHLGAGADVTDSASLEAAVEEVVAAFGGLDVVVANAGIGEAGTVAIRDADALVRVIDINLSGVVRTVRATLEHVEARDGYFLLVSSAAALKNVFGGSTYAASKAGVEAFGGALRLEVAHKGVGVGVAHPAWIETDMLASQMELPFFRESLKALPWPFSAVTPVGECADAFADAIEHRRRKVYVPGALAYVDKVRGVFTGALWDVVVKRKARKQVPALERDVLERERTRG
jgi:NAD(P)-dependent dehydrogenase (short-subunit alcohol dehydrogenase family)